MKYINTYLIFNGNCRQAMEFYHQCLGGHLDVMSYGDAPGMPADFPKEAKSWLIHARLQMKTQVLMASDTRPDMLTTPGNNFFISINCETIEESEKLFKSLSQNGQVEMPLQETFWAHRFAMFTDKFWIKWMLNVEKPKE